MESTKFPIVIKKRNGVMIGVSILEIVMGIMFGIIADGPKSVLLWIFVITGIITALSVLVEYNQDIILKENNVEFYKNNDLIKSIKYSSINAIYIAKGNETKTKKKDFLTIGFNGNDNKSNKNSKNNKSKNSKGESYPINHSVYSSQDLNTLNNIILMKNSSIKVSDDVKNLTNKIHTTK
ncbi:MAG TPA: hypothetical protein VF839_03985 [Clostridium sp.]